MGSVGEATYGRGVRFDTAPVGLHLGGERAASDINENSNANKDAVAKLLKELDDAQSTGKNQTVQQLRDKLNEKRKELGDEEFKKILEQLKEEMSRRWLELLKMLFPDLFADTPSPSPQPSPSPGGGGGGGGGRVNPGDYGKIDSMSEKNFTEGANHTNYTPDKSNPRKKPGTGTEPGNIWSGFRQGPDGNCITVSAIKAAMMRFGQKPTDIFKDVRASGDGWDVQMRDGFQLHLSRGELKQAAEQARFLGTDDAMMTDANFLFAASAKRAHMEGNRGGWDENDANARRSYRDALKSLNDGEHGSEGLMRLGLKDHIRQTNASELAAGKIGVVNRAVSTLEGPIGHSMAVINGREEAWGGRGNPPPSDADAYALD